MKVIDLLNKIANGEETHFDTKLNGKCVVVRYYNDRNFSSSTDPEMLTIADIIKSLNNEIEIIKEDKKIEKIIPTSLRGIDNLDEKIEIAHIDTISAIDKINEIIDYINGGINGE